MKRRNTVSPHFVVCIKNRGCPASLELHKIYRVIPDVDAANDGDIRVVDESGEDYLYPAEWFVELKLPQAIQNSLKKRSRITARSTTTRARAARAGQRER